METLELTKTKKQPCCGSDCCADEKVQASDQAIKDMVKDKYAQIAQQSKETNETSCCGTACCDSVDYTIMSEDYTKLEGYNPDADLGLGCGIPTATAKIAEGMTVIDLGSGAGNDAFVARRIVGHSGKVIGVDMTPAMIERARANNDKLGFNNVEFRLGDIENLPITDHSGDVVVSNCVLNLVPNKRKAFDEIHRILKPGGHFSISDIVLDGQLPPAIQRAAEMYAGCVAGAIQKSEYIEIIKEAGFTEVGIAKEKEILLPDDILKQYLSPAELTDYRKSGLRILSITVIARK